MESYIKTEGSRSSTWFLDSIIHSTNELVVIVNENTRLLDVIETGVADIESTQRINGKNMIATRIPIKKDGRTVGAFGRVLFKDVDDLKKLYEKINRMKTELNLYKSRFLKLNSAKYSLESIIGSSRNMRQLKNSIKIVAKTNSNVLILGESGTGK